MNIIFILDRQKKIIGYLSNAGAKPIAPFFNDLFTQELATGTETFEFTTVNNSYTSKLIKLGNYVMFMYKGKYKMFQMIDAPAGNNSKRHITMYCEGIGLELIGDYCEPFKMEGNINTFLTTIFQDTEFRIGHIDDELLNVIKNVQVEKTEKVYKVLQENISTFDNIEIEFNVKFINNEFKYIYIDVYAERNRGNKTYKKFEVGVNVDYIQRKSNIYDFASAGIGEGANGINFRNIEWSIDKGDPTNKPLGQNFVVNPVANDKYNRGSKYIKKPYSFDTEDARELLRLTYDALLKDGEPKNDYEVALAMTSKEFRTVSIGDTVHVCDFYYIPAVLLEARVSKLTISFTDPTQNKCTLSNYKELISKLVNLEHEYIYGSMLDYINSLPVGLLTTSQVKQLTVYLEQLDFEEEEINSLISQLEKTASDKFEEENRHKVKGDYIDILCSPGRNYLCDTVKYLKYRLPNVVTEDYETTLQFTTTKDTEPTQFNQSTLSWLTGDDCINGALIPKADTTYTIILSANKDADISQIYYGVVTKESHGGSNIPYTNKSDYTDKIQEVMKTYYSNRNKFKYGFTTIFSFSNPCTESNRNKWTNSDGRFNIDCSTFVQLCIRGIDYDNSTYNLPTVSPYFLSTKYTYPFILGKRTASDQAKACIENGWQLDVDMSNKNNWRQLQTGDIVFWETRGEASEDRVANRYMRVSHVAIVSTVLSDGDVTTYEATSVDNVILNRRLSNNEPERILFVARPRK